VLLKNIGNIGNTGNIGNMKCKVKKLCASENVGNVEH
jgi:hypothetical protein